MIQIVIFVIDLKSYELLLDKLGSELFKLSMAKVQVVQNHAREGRYLSLLYFLKRETPIMELQ